MAMERLKISDLVNESVPVQVVQATDSTPAKCIMVRALSLREIVKLLVQEREGLLALLVQGMSSGEEGVTIEKLAPFLLSTPSLVAKIIAFASDEDDDAAEAIEKRMPATVQLIAIQEIWKLSVPDAKKGQELLSGVMALLSKASEKVKESKNGNKVSATT